MTTIFEHPVTCENCSHVIGAVEIASHNNFTGTVDPESDFEIIDECPACGHELDHELLVWRDSEPISPSAPDHEASP